MPLTSAQGVALPPNSPTTRHAQKHALPSSDTSTLVLVVEDDADTAALYRSILSTHYPHVAVSECGRDAVTTLLSHSGPAVVILDFHLPDMTGIDVMTTCRDMPWSIACMMVSGDELTSPPGGCGEEIRLVKPLGCQALLQWTARLVEKVQKTPQESSSTNLAPHHLLLGESPAMQRIHQLIPRLAQSSSPLWLHGESGTGKELAARSVHYCSPRSSGPFVAVNCAAFPDNLIESMLFGHVKGAFSGATRDHKGFFEAADGGTLFLDEVGDMPLAFQAKLLRALQTSTITPVGTTKPVTVDCRIIAACHRDLAHAVAQGEFREDLYYRLNVLDLLLPPLRDRAQDALVLAEHLIDTLSREERTRPCPLDDSAKQWILQHHWPGNVRELENLLRRALVLHDGDTLSACDLDREAITATDIPPSPASSISLSSSIRFIPGDMTLREIEDAAIEACLRACDGCVEQAARQLGIAASTLHRRRRRKVA